MNPLFGPSGNSEEFYASNLTSTIQAPQWLKSQGLDAFEYSFGRGYIMSSETAKQLGEEFKKYGIALSIHAPYFINFATPDDLLLEKSKGYISTGIKFLRNFGADRLIFHPGSAGKMDRHQAYLLAKDRIISFADELQAQGLLDGIYLCPETMGKSQQIGTYEEILQICKANDHLIPTFDFGHINSLLGGALKTKQDFLKILNRSIEVIGYQKTANAHIHFSKIEYGAKGEIRHLNFDDEIYGPNFQPLAEALIELNLHPRILSESAGHQSQDAREMKNIYQNLLAQQK